MKSGKKLLTILAVITAVLSATFVAITRQKHSIAQAVNGRVFEVMNPYSARQSWKLEPLPDAEILIVWRAEVSAFADSTFMCVRAEFTRSGPDGSFFAPASKIPQTSESPRAASYAYKPGYLDVSTSSTSLGFDSTVDHVRILRKVIDTHDLPSRDQQFIGAYGCPAEKEEPG